MANFASNYSFPSPSSKKSATSFLLGLTAFASKAFSDAEPATSPTSILDGESFAAPKSPVWTEPGSGVGLGIVDSLSHDPEYESGSGITKKKLIVVKKPENSKYALFGSHLKIQIPTSHNSFSVDSPKSSMEFGIKTKNSQLGLGISPKCSSGSPLNFNGSISSSEMELSEDYTCIISRGGQVTKMTRIFDDCIVESSFGDPGLSSSSSVKKYENGASSVSPDGPNGYQFENFLSFCHTCRKNLGEGKDIYMYRGEKGFCSEECRRREMLMEETLEKKHGALDEDGFGSW